jgi:hypothetical protein
MRRIWMLQVSNDSPSADQHVAADGSGQLESQDRQGSKGDQEAYNLMAVILQRRGFALGRLEFRGSTKREHDLQGGKETPC